MARKLALSVTLFTISFAFATFSAFSQNSTPLIFVQGTSYDSGGYTASGIAMGDLNGDGKLDLVVGNECANSGCLTGGAAVAVLLANGDGTFQPALTYSSGGSSHPFFPVKIAIGDVNGDGKPDLIVVNGDSATVGVLLGNGDGTFQSAMTYGTVGLFPVSVAIADVNGDGKPDLLVATECKDSNCDGSVSVLLGNGDGTFRTAVTYSSGGVYGLSVAVADVNGDGAPDLLIANGCASLKLCSINGGVAVLLGKGDGTFQSATQYLSGGAYPYSLAVGDLNGDGKLDVAVANSFSGTAGVLLGNGDGTFQAAATYTSGELSSAQISSVAIADVNGDGRPDLLLTTEAVGRDGNNGGAVAVLAGNGDGTFQAAVNYASGGYQTLGVAIGDVNGDGKPDLLVANSCSYNSPDCGGPVNKTRGTVSLLLNNYGAPPTETSLVSSANPVEFNSAVTYTATVTAQSGATLRGKVTFHDGYATIATVALASGQAACTTSYTTNGTHAITATYSGDLNRAAGSTSAVLVEQVLKPFATTTAVTTSGTPSLVGQAVTFTATVRSKYGVIPDSETVTFYDATTATALASIKLVGGTAIFTTSTLSGQRHYIEAKYGGDVTFAPSFGAVTQIVKKYPTATTLSSFPDPSNFGRAVTFTARVKGTGPIAPEGKVRFRNGRMGTTDEPLIGGVAKFTISTLSIGTHQISAIYLSDVSNAGSKSYVLNQVVK